ncbi:MAG: GAF domain-containing protein [Anaerolineae bacterium]|jgi:GAF domain-containing protein|uniref:GAF domain-containing protein n=1 Tax=Candidatus Flexifilum breve TaxID=3140694 RepID=UPI001AC589AA|nr:GAF domain-containing protein [Chloroflexota bacterium]MBN8633853.1 GAF domain-containing protein [Anaerolineae bacterium]
MLHVLRTPLSTERYKTVADKARARAIMGLTVGLVVIYSLFLIVGRSGALAFSDMQGIDQRLDLYVPLALIAMYGGALATVIITRLGKRTASAYMMLASFYAASIVISIPNGLIYAPMGAPLLVMIMIGGFLLGERGIGLTTGLSTLIVAGAMLQRQNIPNAPDNAPFAFILFTVLFVLTGLILQLFLRLQEIGLDEKVGKAARGRQELATLTTQLAQRISRHFILSELLDSTVEDIRKTYPDIYHVQIFLTDEEANEARLVASTGEVGKMLLRRKHSLPIGSRSVIGQVTATSTAVIAAAAGTETVHRRNEYLPDTAAEAAFPLRLGNALIGALDLQSKQVDAFSDPDGLSIFQSLADSIAIAVDNARLFEQTESRVQENQRLLDQMRTTMREVERLNLELTGRSWQTFLSYKGDELGVTVDLDNNIVRQSAEITPTLSTAMRDGRTVQAQASDLQVISTPLRVRGQVIGAMEFEVGADEFTPEDIELVNGVAERFSLALESARIYEESRRVAQRESTLNQIGSRLQTTNTVDTLLAETARGLQASLGATRVAIRLGAPPKSNGVEEH